MFVYIYFCNLVLVMKQFQATDIDNTDRHQTDATGGGHQTGYLQGY